MKKYVLLFLLVCCSQLYTQAQDRKPCAIGLQTSFGSASIIQTPLTGGPSYETGSSFGIGLRYEMPLGQRLSIETMGGIFQTETVVTPHTHPDMDMSSQTYDLRLLSLQAGIKYNFLPYLFMNGGILFDADLENEGIDSQTGFGFGLGVGAEFKIGPNIQLMINPYLNQHAILPFQRENYPQRVLDAGLRLGVAYRLQH